MLYSKFHTMNPTFADPANHQCDDPEDQCCGGGNVCVSDINGKSYCFDGETRGYTPLIGILYQRGFHPGRCWLGTSDTDNKTPKEDKDPSLPEYITRMGIWIEGMFARPFTPEELTDHQIYLDQAVV
jgi:hypothetical protein